jgi:hypothetical protein
LPHTPINNLYNIYTEINFQIEQNTTARIVERAAYTRKIFEEFAFEPFEGLSGEEFKKHFPCALRPLANTDTR